MRNNLLISSFLILALIVSGCSLDITITQKTFPSQIKNPVDIDKDPGDETLTVNGPPDGELPDPGEFALSMSGQDVSAYLGQIYQGSNLKPNVNIAGLVPGNLVTLYQCTMPAPDFICTSTFKFTATKSSHSVVFDNSSAAASVFLQVSIEGKDNLKIDIESTFNSFVIKAQDSAIKPNNTLAYLYTPPLPPAPSMNPLVLALVGSSIDSKKIFTVSLQQYGQHLPDQRGYVFKLFRSATCTPGTEVDMYGSDLNYSVLGSAAPYTIRIGLDEYGSATPTQSVVLSALQENVNGATACSNSVTYSYQKPFVVNFKHYAYSAKYETPYPTPSIEVSLSDAAIEDVRLYYSFGNSTHDLTGIAGLDQYIQIPAGQTSAIIPMPSPPIFYYNFVAKEIEFFEMNLQYVGQGLGTIGKYSTARIVFTPPSSAVGYNKIYDLWSDNNDICIGKSPSGSLLTADSFYQCDFAPGFPNWATASLNVISSATGFKKFSHPVFIGGDGKIYYYDKLTSLVSLFEGSRTYKDLNESCALADNNRVYCWGDIVGQVFGYDPVANAPVEISTNEYVSLAERNGESHGNLQCALNISGAVDCWRKNYTDPLENFSNTDGYSYLKIFIGNYFSSPTICGIRVVDNSFYCDITTALPWKLEDSDSTKFKDMSYYLNFAQRWIGIDHTDKAIIFDRNQLIQPSGVSVQKVVTNYWQSCFLDVNSVVFCSNNYMQEPFQGYQILEKHKTFKYLRNSASYNFGSSNRVCAIDNNDALFCSGLGEGGNGAYTATAIGDGTGYRREHFVRIDPAYTYKNVSIAAKRKSVGVRTDGTAVAWGFQENDNGTGPSSGNVNELKPIVVDSGYKYIYMEAGEGGKSLTCGLTAIEGDGFNRVRCRNFTSGRSVFNDIAFGKKFNYLGVSVRSVHLVDQDGKLYLYDDRVTGSSYPYNSAKTIVAVDTSETYSAWSKTCGLTVGGKFRCAVSDEYSLDPITYLEFAHPDNFVTLGPDNCAVDENEQTYCFNSSAFVKITSNALTTFKIPGAGCGLTNDNKISCKVNHTVNDGTATYEYDMNIRSFEYIYSPTF